MRSLLIVSKESVLDRLYKAVIYATLRFAQAATVGLIISVGSIQIEAFHSGAASQPIRNVAWGPLLSAAVFSGGRDNLGRNRDFEETRTLRLALPINWEVFSKQCKC
jgi:hypothetical protein